MLRAHLAQHVEAGRAIDAAVVTARAVLLVECATVLGQRRRREDESEEGNVKGSDPHHYFT